jgi:hypothetical protein
MIHTTPHDTEQDLLLKALDILKELKEELVTTSFQDSREKSMAEVLAEEREARNELSMEELLVLEQAAITRAKFRKAALLDCDDDSDNEDTLDIHQFYKGSSDSSFLIPPIENQGENNVTKSLAIDQMEFEKSITASPSKLPQSVVITSEVHTHSLNMGDEHLSTVPNKESDELIKSSVEILVPIPRESQGTFDHMCDIPPSNVISQDHFEIFSDSNDECTSYGEIEFVDASLPHSDADSLLEEFSDELAHMDPVPPGDEVFDFEADLRELESLLTHDPSIDSSCHEEFYNELTHTYPLPSGGDDDLFDFKDDLEEVEVILAVDSSTSYEVDDNYLDSEGDILFLESLLHDDPSINSYPNTELNDSHINDDSLSFGDIDYVEDFFSKLVKNDLKNKILILIAIKISLPSFTYPVISPVLHSFGNEDTIFYPGISIYDF